MKRAIGSMLVAAGVACADTLHVPGDYPTIQGAINAAEGGDVVLVADGTYSGTGNVNLDTLGKAITVKSQGGAGSCAIDGQSAARGFLVQTGEGPSTRIEGFTISNGAADLGGGIYLAGAGPTIKSCVITGCSADGGGGLYSGGGAPMLVECEFSGNIANVEFARGGGVAIVGGTATLTGCTFTDNRVGDGQKADPGLGGGLFFSGASLSATDCVFDANHADVSQGTGGGIYIGSGTGELTGCTFTNNTAGRGAPGAGRGGGLGVSVDSSAALKGCKFEGNNAGGGIDGAIGGAVYARGPVACEDCTFHSNYADFGGAVSADPAPVFARCTFTENSAADFAGAVSAGEGASFTDCRFEGNHARYFGVGAVGTTGAVFSRCVFVANRTEGQDPDSGGAAVWSNGGTLFANCLFAHNFDTFEGDGGALVLEEGDRVVNCVFFGNTVDDGTGSVIWAREAGVTVSNSVFWGNGPGLVKGTVDFAYCDVEGGYAGPGNIDADPLFLDPEGLDFHLGDGSPCIDAGSNPAVPHGIDSDLDGAPRFYDDPATADTGVGPPPVVDMGAYEFGSTKCYADFNGDGVLDLFDFLAFVNAFNDGNPYADCTGDGQSDLFDFLCFVNEYNQGC